MPGKPLPNYLLTARKRSGLSQREVAVLVGVASDVEVSRHETFRRLPGLVTALRYEAIFGVSVRELFAGEYQKVEKDVHEQAKELAQRILVPGPRGAQKRQTLARILHW